MGEIQRGKKTRCVCVCVCTHVMCARVTHGKRREGDVHNDNSVVIGSAGTREGTGAD